MSEKFEKLKKGLKKLAQSVRKFSNWLRDILDQMGI